MGVVLYYRSASPVDELVHREIVGESRALENDRDWWAEPIYFYAEPRKPGELAGRTKISPPDEFISPRGGIVAVDAKDGWFMVYADVRFIVTQLCGWSMKHGLSWTLSCDGYDVGRIERGSVDEALSKFLRGLAKNGAASLNETADESRYEEIARRYQGLQH